MFKFVRLLVLPPMEQVIRMCVVWPEVYQKSVTTAFNDSVLPSSSMTFPMLQDYHGDLCQHIWTYATGRSDHQTLHNSENYFICPCANRGSQSGPSSPSYVGMNYYFESGTEN